MPGRIRLTPPRSRVTHQAFILDQRDELEAAGPLELAVVVPVGGKESSVGEIEQLTDLDFRGMT